MGKIFLHKLIHILYTFLTWNIKYVTASIDIISSHVFQIEFFICLASAQVFRWVTFFNSSINALILETQKIDTQSINFNSLKPSFSCLAFWD
jgi:hypothetical protein